MSKSKSKQKTLEMVIIPAKHPNPPEQHELDSAFVLAEHYKYSVEFLLPIDDYKRKTADIKMLGVVWELKCPTGSSRSTIENQFRRARKQAKNIVFDTRLTKLGYEEIEKKVLAELKMRPSLKKVKRVVLINKFSKIVELKK